MLIWALIVQSVFSWDYTLQGTSWTDTCGKGDRQSPIDILTDDTEDLGSQYSMQVYYYGKTASRTIKNGGNYIYMEGDFGYITIKDDDDDERKFLTDWVEFHMPSEHFIDGFPTHMEMQIFHTIDDSDYTVDFPNKAVVSVMIRPGDSSYFMQSIQVESMPNKGSELVLPETSNINLLAIIDPDDEYYFYKGSFNKPEPECTENVLWYVFETEQWVSFEQMSRFKELWIDDTDFNDGKGNVREIQSQKGRTVYYSWGSNLVSCAVFLMISLFL